MKIFNVLWENKGKIGLFKKEKWIFYDSCHLLWAGRLLTFRYNNYVIWMKVPGGRRKKSRGHHLLPSRTSAT